MGYRGKVTERQQARQLRRTGLPLAEIAARLGVSKISVSLWVRDVDFEPVPPGHPGPSPRPEHPPAPAAGPDRPLLAEGRDQGLDLDAATAYWSALTGIHPTQLGAPYRAVPDPSIRHAKHVHGCATVSYSCSLTHRSIMGLVGALLSDAAVPG